LNIVYVHGGTNKQKQLTENIIHYCIQEMMPKIRTLCIEVYLQSPKNMDGDLGTCLNVDGTNNSREFELELDKTQKKYKFILTTCHEMVHVEQGVRNRLKDKNLRQFWNGDEVATSYYKQPWEKDAFARQKPLAHGFIKRHLGTITGVRYGKE